MEKRNCIIIHGCPSEEEKNLGPESRTYDKHWIPWTKKQLEDRGINTETPLMPEPWHPVYENFKREFEKYSVDEDTTLIGHSCGCAFLVRWLGETKKKIDRLILVAPWKINDEQDEFRENFYTFPIDKSIAERVNKIYFFTSNTEEENGKKSLKMYHDALSGEIISLPNHSHYTLADMGIDKFPELIKEIIN